MDTKALSLLPQFFDHVRAEKFSDILDSSYPMSFTIDGVGAVPSREDMSELFLDFNRVLSRQREETFETTSRRSGRNFRPRRASMHQTS